MTLFSQRMGIIPLEKAIQLESMDQELRYGLWNFLHVCFWDQRGTDIYSQLDGVARRIWFAFFKLPIDECPKFFTYDTFGDLTDSCAFAICRKFFLNTNAKWYQLYDFIEFIYQEFKLTNSEKNNAKKFLNHILERENAAYRFVGSQFVAISDENEIKAIETELIENGGSVASHFKRALLLLADRKSPDYRNSIKESISAVESLCASLAGGNTKKFSDALTELEKMCSFHPALKRAFLQLYGYTSDSGGIRHALTDESEHPSYADAKFMLVTCSAFCNFLKAKTSESPQ